MPSAQQNQLLSSRKSYPRERQELYDRASHHQSPITRRSVLAPGHGRKGSSEATPLPPSTVRENPGMSFMLLSESQWSPPKEHNEKEQRTAKGVSPRDLDTVKGEDATKSFSKQLETTARLFEILSSRSDIDHPICVECTELLVEGLQKRLASSTRERDAYADFLKKLNAEVPTEEEIKKTQKILDKTLAAEKSAFTKLEELEREKSEVDQAVAALEEEARALDLEEETFWRERNAFTLILTEFQDERDGVNLRFDHDSRQLERLQRTNVYNDTFCIGHDGYFGTINSLRLGRLPNQPVDWPEINAAWGQTLLLLSTLANKFGFIFEGYRLKPMGSTSRIEKIDLPQSSSTDQTSALPPKPKIIELELFSSGDLPIVGRMMHRAFDNAMVAFLDCLQQLASFLDHRAVRLNMGNAPEGLKLPYVIRNHKIGDASIKLGFNQDEIWTKACKYTLTCCKFLLAHASHIAARQMRQPTDR